MLQTQYSRGCSATNQPECICAQTTVFKCVYIPHESLTHCEGSISRRDSLWVFEKAWCILIYDAKWCHKAQGGLLDHSGGLTAHQVMATGTCVAQQENALLFMQM